MYPIRRNPDLGTNQTLPARYEDRMTCKIEFSYVPKIFLAILRANEYFNH